MTETAITVKGHAPQAINSFQKHFIDYRITLHNGRSFKGRGSQLVLRNYRSQASISYGGGNSMGQLHARIYNLDPDYAASLSTIGQYRTDAVGKVRVEVLAGSSEDGKHPGFMPLVFDGGLYSAWLDHSQAPESCMVLTAQVGIGEASMYRPDTAYEGSVAVADMLANLAAHMRTTGTSITEIREQHEKGTLDENQPVAFQNCGVTAMATNPHYQGDVITQIRTICRDFGIRWKIERGVFSIWPEHGSYKPPGMGGAPYISSRSGMIGYPSFDGQNVSVSSIFRPDIYYGQPVRIVSPFMPDAREYNYMSSLQHELTQGIPGGAWTTTISAAMVRSSDETRDSQ